MTLLRFEPLREFENIQDQLKRYIDDISSGGISYSGKFSPRADISESGSGYTVSLELPGVRKEDVKIVIEDNLITIEGEKKSGEGTKDRKYFREERNFGSFKRCFTFPESIDSNTAEARFSDGILTINVHKLVKKANKEIEIKL